MLLFKVVKTVNHERDKEPTEDENGLLHGKKVLKELVKPRLNIYGIVC